MTLRDFKFFVFGILAFLAIETAVNWKSSKEAFAQGFNASK